MQTVATTTILCVDDHRLVRDGITLIINREHDMKVIATASAGDEAVNLFREHRPDITLMDLQLPSMNGIDATKAIRQIDSAARIIVLTVFQGDEDIHRALRLAPALIFSRTPSRTS